VYKGVPSVRCACGGTHDGGYRLAVQPCDLCKLAQRRASAMSDADHVIADKGFLRSSFGAQTHDNQCRADLTVLAASILVHGCDRRRYLSRGVAHDSSRSARASLSRVAISSGTRGETSTLASASLRCAKV